MIKNYKNLLDQKLSVNSYLWAHNLDPYDFLDTIKISGIKNVGLHNDFIKNVGLVKLKSYLTENKISVTSINSIGYFTDKLAFNDYKLTLEYAKILNPDVICVISGGLKGGPLKLRDNSILNQKFIDPYIIRKKSTDKLKFFFKETHKYQVRLGIEPIGPWEIITKGHFNDIASCLKLIKNTDHKLIIDLYHSFVDINLENFIKKSKYLGLLQFSNIKFDINSRLIGRKKISFPSEKNDLNIAKYLKYVFERQDNTKIEFEISPNDLQGNDPKKIIMNLKDNILKLFI